MAKKFGLFKNEIIRKKVDFEKIFKRKKIFSNLYITMYILEKTKEENKRFGLIISKKIGNSVRRNKIKRLLREVFRLNKYRLKKGTNMIFIARPEIKKMNKYQQIERILMELWSKAGLLIKEYGDEKYCN